MGIALSPVFIVIQSGYWKESFQDWRSPFNQGWINQPILCDQSSVAFLVLE
jgi:hypothetical protein